MGVITRSQLQFKDEYKWTTTEGDSARHIGKPDNVLLNRNEGYEVLYYLNSVCKESLGQALKAERLIRNHLPGTVRARDNITQWLRDNWNKF